MKIIGIACLNNNRAIGYQNRLIYNLIADMKLFKSNTIKTNDISKINAVLMGANTYMSIPKKNLPLTQNCQIL